MLSGPIKKNIWSDMKQKSWRTAKQTRSTKIPPGPTIIPVTKNNLPNLIIAQITQIKHVSNMQLSSNNVKLQNKKLPSKFETMVCQLSFKIQSTLCFMRF